MYLSLIASKKHAKTVKNAVEKYFSAGQGTKVAALQSHAELDGCITSPDFMMTENLCIIHTDQIVDVPDVENPRFWLESLEAETVNSLHLEAINLEIWIVVSKNQDTTTREENNKHSLRSIVHRWLLQLPPVVQSALPLPIPQLLSIASWSYTIYPPLLLLPPNTFKTPPWPSVLNAVRESHLSALYDLICNNMHVTHIAFNAPIPLLSSATEQNTIRAPITLTPLHGDFGTYQAPSPSGFSSAFWVSTRQHGIYQTWAPLYTMFSRGNISEKFRILNMPELRSDALGSEPGGTSAVDLYAGIGYFAFCYAKAGVGRVLGWELNGWSVEGFRRGAERNKWSVSVVSAEEEVDERAEERLVVFHEDNQNAVSRIEKMRDRIPPVRHVNCGFLPSSEASWNVAVKLLDPVLGGWVHVHENIAEGDIEDRRAEITKLYRELVGKTARGTESSLRCLHLQRVKSYAPGIIHCVLDIYIPRLAFETVGPPNANAKDALPNRVKYSIR